MIMSSRTSLAALAVAAVLAVTASAIEIENEFNQSNESKEGFVFIVEESFEDEFFETEAETSAPAEAVDVEAETTAESDIESVSESVPVDVPALMTGFNGITAYPHELETLCAIAELEAGGESEECIKAVTQTILNRLNSGIWGSTLTDVLYAKTFDGRWEFSTIPNVSNAVIQDSTKEAVMDVWENGLEWCKPSVLYFHDTTYHTFYGAVDEFSVDNMYFSSSIWNQLD